MRKALRTRQRIPFSPDPQLKGFLDSHAIMNLLNWIGKPFVYRSPKELDGFKSHLRHFPNWYLRQMAGKKPMVYRKADLIELIINDM